MLENGDKLVIMAHHHDVIDQLAEALAEFGAVKFDGRMSLKDRDASVGRFQTENGVRVFVGGIQAAGVGITLTAASHVVFAELDWVPGNLAQAEDRCHRIGQTDSVLVQHLVLDGSLDARMAQIIVEKMDVITAAIDSKDADNALQAPKPLVAPEKPVQAPPVPGADDLTGQQVQAVHDALRIIAGLCDGAQVLDGMGFNKLDTGFGHDLAHRVSLSQKQAKYGQDAGDQIPEASSDRSSRHRERGCGVSRPLCGHCGKPYGRRDTHSVTVRWEDGEPEPRYGGDGVPVRRSAVRKSSPAMSVPSRGGAATIEFKARPNARDLDIWDGKTWTTPYAPFCTLRCALEYARKAFRKAEAR